MPERSVPDAVHDVAALILSARANDEDAFTELYRMTVRQLYRYVSVRISGAEDVEEVTQEVYMAAVTGIQGLRAGDEAGLYGWLYQIARNKVADHLRRRYRRPVEPLDDTLPLADPDPTPEDIAEVEAERALVRSALDQLTPDQREVLLCKYVMDYSNDQTARQVGKNVNSVNQLHHRALASLARLLGGGQRT